MNKYNTRRYYGILILAICISACEKYEVKTFPELRERMNTTYIGFQSGDGTQSFDDQEVNLIPVGDSSALIVGMFYDSLLVKIEKVDFSDGLVSGSGDSIFYFVYIDETERLTIQKDLTPFRVFRGKRKD